MNPLTDLSTKMIRADGTTVEIIQPGARLIASGVRLKLEKDGDQTTILLPPTAPDPIASVIRLE